MTCRIHIAGTLLCLLIALTLALPNTPRVSALPCPTVEAIAVPGTTQTNPAADPTTPVGILGNILEPLQQRSKITLATYYIPYPATIAGGTDGGGYKASKDAGIDRTNARLKAVASLCSQTLFFLTGYSQGADIAGDIAAAVGHNKGVIPADRLLGVALLADPSQSPIDQPTIGLSAPGMGFAGVRAGGFGSLTERILSLCAPLDYYCNLPQADLVMRFIGHLGSHLDASDPAGSAQNLATMFMAGLIAPATAAISQILKLVNDPDLIPHLFERGVVFAKALAQQLFALAGPQVAATATDLVNTATQVINLVQSRAWTAIPAMITVIATKAPAVGAALSQMHDKITMVNIHGFAAVGTQLAQPSSDVSQLTTAVLHAITVATGGLGLQSTGIFGPTFAQFSPATVAAALKHFAEFIKGGFHTNYDTTVLDSAGHTGTQLVQRYFVNQLNKLV